VEARHPVKAALGGRQLDHLQANAMRISISHCLRTGVALVHKGYFH
jgi:hypothetical protein